MVSQLRFKAKPLKPVRQIQGLAGSLQVIQKNVSALITHERIETTENKAFLTRQYTEKLIGDALLHGDKHKHTMEMATWWLDNVSVTHHCNPKWIVKKVFKEPKRDCQKSSQRAQNG